MSLTELAQDRLGQFILKAYKSKIIVRCQNVFEDEITLTITLDDVAQYYATQARNMSSGCRTLAGLTSDWRMVDQLASMALYWFKEVNVRGMRTAGRRFGLTAKF